MYQIEIYVEESKTWVPLDFFYFAGSQVSAKGLDRGAAEELLSVCNFILNGEFVYRISYLISKKNPDNSRKE
jgi:hypothetical protein